MHELAVAEDDPDNRLLMRAMLEDRSQLVSYRNGREARDGMRAERPDLVRLDISRPGMGGSEVLRHMRRAAALATVPVIALTRHGIAGDREHYLGQGFTDYIAEPIVDERVLGEALERHLG